MSTLGNHVIIEWEAWDQFLLPYVLPDARRVSIDPFSCNANSLEIEQAQLICFQLNLSCIDELPFVPRVLTNKSAHRNATLINVDSNDITKRRLQSILMTHNLGSLLVESPTDDDYLVIVKTNLNHGGVVEKRNSDRLPSEAACKQFICDDLGPMSYPVLHVREVPDSLFSDKAYSVERFVTNEHEYFYRVYFAGARRVAVKAYCPGPIKKISGTDEDRNFAFHCADQSNIVDILNPSAVNISVALPALMHAEFGCIDIVVSDEGQSYAVDFNTTPWAGSVRPGDDILEYLRGGLLELADHFIAPQDDCAIL